MHLRASFVATVLLWAVATACGRALTGPVDERTTTTPVEAAEPSGVLLWLHDGARSWPPDLWALDLGDRDASKVRLPSIAHAVDWAWAPDVSSLVWAEEVPDGVPGARVVMGEPDGSSPTVVGELRHWNDYLGRAWSPDAARFAYAAYTDTGTTIWVVDAATATSTAVRSWEDPAWADVDWSPDGSRLVVGLAGDAGETGVITMGTDGSDERRISDRPATRVRWSPDGTTIAMESGDHPGPPGIYVVSANGGSVRRLSPPDVTEMLPVWSPDGAWIAFASERDAVGLPPRDAPRRQPLIDAGIYLMRPDGSDVRRVVEPVDVGWAESWDWLEAWPPGG
ncbi:MAG TPA: hypothetical protein VLA82_00630 [Actinomycetota bacterium]|nr:hypothetical protein [Actinomycetota bacterium]